MNVIVSQYGARRRYLVPQILNENNMLQYLYTDSHRDSLLGRIIRLLKQLGISNVSINRLLKRETKLPLEKVKANDWLQVKLLFNKLLHKPNSESVNAIFEGSSNKFIGWGVKDTDWLYTMFIENIEFTKYAKSKGVRIIADIYENPYIFKELYDDVKSIPEYNSIQYYGDEQLDQYQLRIKHIDTLLETADIYLVPSSYVADSISRSRGFDSKKVRIVPYASSVTCTQYNNTPRKGRIIWVGNDPVRKGLVYALRAFKKLKEKYTDLEFRVIGPVPEQIKNAPEFDVLNFVGYLNKEQLINELKLADMFVFPTLSEGFAGVLLEAASYGVPIITTHASGFDNDFPGIFIRERNISDIENAIELLLNDRAMRMDISHKIFEYSQRFDSSVFSKNLIKIINNE